jgi:hypothetical protein
MRANAEKDSPHLNVGMKCVTGPSVWMVPEQRATDVGTSMKSKIPRI